MKKIRFLAVTIVATPLLLATDVRADAGGNGKPKSCSAIILSADEMTDTKPGNGKTFRATTILDVKVRAVIPASALFGDDEVVAFRFTTPAGHHYQTIEVPVESAKKPGERERRRDGYPFSLQVQKPNALKVNGQGAQSVEARLLVAGTAIMDNGLYGTWTVEGFVGDARPCSARFTLQP